MATKVEMTSRTVQSGLSDVKAPRTRASPLSDASNKSSDSSSMGSFFFEEANTTPNKYVSRFNPGTRPRISPKPFSREKPLETRNFSDFTSKLLSDESPTNDVPSPTSYMSLSDSGKKDETGSTSQRFYRSTLPPSSEKDQSMKSEQESSYSGRRLYSSTWVPGVKSVEESKLTSSLEEMITRAKPEVSYKLPVSSKKPEISQSKESFHASTSKMSSPDKADKQKGICIDEKTKSPITNIQCEDSSSVRAQLRPKRRPVSAMFLNSINDQSPDNQVASDDKAWIRKPRPLSVDLTAKFETRGSSIATNEASSEETKENIPMKKPSVDASILEEKVEIELKGEGLSAQSELARKGHGPGINKIEVSSGMSLKHTYSTFLEKDLGNDSTLENKFNSEEEIGGGENQIMARLTENYSRTVKPQANEKKSVFNDSANVTSESNHLDENAIAPGMIRRRISLFSSSNSPGEATESSASKDDKGSPVAMRRAKVFTSDNTDINSGRPRTSSQSRPLSSDLTKIFSSSPPSVEPRPEKTMEMQTAVPQDYENLKDKANQKTIELPGEKTTWKPRRSFKYSRDEISDDTESFPNGRKNFLSREKVYDTTSGIIEVPDKYIESAENSFKTVKATVFEHNVEWHSPAKVYHTVDPKPNQPAKSEPSSDVFAAKSEYHNWTDRFDGDVSPNRLKVRDDNESDLRISERQVGKAAPSTERRNPRTDYLENVPSSLKKENDNVAQQKIEPRYEILQTVGDRALSESIKIVPEDKAVTLRSRRSFHNKEREPYTHEFENPSDHTWSKLQRSKSEYHKRDTYGSSQESIVHKPTHTGFDIQTHRSSFRSERSSAVKALADLKTNRARQANKALGMLNAEEFDLSKNNKTREKHTSEFEGSEREIIKVTTTKPKFGESNQLPLVSDQTSKHSLEKDLESRSDQIRDFRRPLGKSSIFTAEDDTLAVKKIAIKDDTTDFMKSMLDKEIEQIKKDLIPNLSPTKEIGSFKKEKKEASVSDEGWVRGKTSFRGGEAGIRGDYLTTAQMTNIFVDKKETRQKVDLGYEQDSVHNPTTTEPSSLDTKATYFAVTYIDTKKEKIENEFVNQSSVTEEFPLKTNVQDGNPYTGLQNVNLSQESYIAREFETSSVTERNAKQSQDVMEENFIKLNEKTSQNVRSNVIDLDALLRRPEKPSTGPSYRDRYSKPSLKDHEVPHEKVGEADLKFGHHEPNEIFKSKAVDIDALMLDYETVKTKDEKVTDVFEEKVQSRWERSRSFRSSAEKGSSSKWKDPSTKSLVSDEECQHKLISSTSRETTSRVERKEDFRFSHVRDPCSSLDDNYGKKSDKIREEQSIPTRFEKSPNTTTVDSLLASSRRTRYERKSHLAQDSSEEVMGKSSRYTSTQKTVSELGVDDDQKSNRSTHIERKSSSVEWSQSNTEKRGPTKTSDLINRMLGDKEREKRLQRTRQNIAVEQTEQSRSQTTSYQKEWTYSDRKEYSEKEVFTQRPAVVHETDLRIESLIQRRSRGQHREKVVQPKQDQVKQCFSRTSATNKDTDSLVPEPDRRNGTWSQEQQQSEDSFESPSCENITSRKRPPHSRLSSLSQTDADQHDSITDLHDASLDRSSMDMDSTDGTESIPSLHDTKATDFSFMDQTLVLDSSALKNRVQLSRKSQRRAPAQRKSRLLQSSSQLEVIEDTDSPWMYTDSTEDKPEKKEDSDEEEKPQRFSMQSQRMPMFPGMDQSTLMAQLRKRKEAESSSEAQAQPSKSPKSPLPQGTLGIKLLPTSSDKLDRGAESSPQWLKELKSKKRQSQYENNS
ncbi:uncharacterized protein KIAA1671 homolog [Pelodytes ibericus]